MSEQRFEKWNDYSCKVKDNQEDTLLDWEDVIHKLNEQQATIEAKNEYQRTLEAKIRRQKRIIKSQDAEINRQYNLCFVMSEILREEFGVYDVFDRSKDKRVK